MQQPVEQMFPALAAGGEAAGTVGSGSETALYGFADCCVFLLDAVTCGDVRQISMASSFGDVREVEIEDDVGAINAARNDKIRIHRPFVAIDHEVRIDPVVN